jgi:hypothetical protein
VDDANGFANNDPGVLWTDPDDTAVRQQVRGRSWTTVDTLNLATDQKVGGSNPSGCAQVKAHSDHGTGL